LAAASAVAAEWEAEKAVLEAQLADAKLEATQAIAMAEKLEASSERASLLESKISALEDGNKLRNAIAAKADAMISGKLAAAVTDARLISDRFSSWCRDRSNATDVRMECRPLRAEDFFERLDTFRPTTWHAFGEVGMICPVECARHGWFNSGVNTLTSTEGAVVRYDANAACGGGGFEQHRAEVRRVRDLIVASGHKMLSQWIGSSCPVSFAGLSVRLSSKQELERQAELIRKCQIGGIVPEGSAVSQVVSGDESAALALQNWRVESLPATGRVVLKCAWCSSQSRPGDGDSGVRSCSPTHYPYCPISAADGWKPLAAVFSRQEPASQ
jgi:hypothetical protein